GSGGAGGGAELQNIYDVARSLDDYSSLVAAVDKAGLADALKDSSASLTVFAPDNDAFAALLSAVGASSLDDLSAEQLRPILLYHVLGTEVDAEAATAAAQSNTKVDGLGGGIQLSLDGMTIRLDDTASVEVADVQASNGVIHGIDAVILPSITDVVVSDTRFSSLATALGVADQDPSDPGLVAALDDNAATFTAFAPTDDAFAALVSALSASPSTGITGLGDFAGYQLIPVLKYHVVAGAAVRAAEVSDGPITTLGGQVVASTGSGVTIDAASVTIADILTKNGVIHVVDGVLLPSITDVVTTAPELSALAGAVIAADGDGATSPKVAPALDAAAASGAYTLFAPDNAAFAALGQAPSGQALTNVLLYHVLNQSTAVYAADALGLNSPTPFDTLLSGGQITVSTDGSQVIIDDSGSQVDATVGAPNYFTENGVIHVIDKVLLPAG
ncbi:MAG: fasciclin domain-containing protein, partial [Myxococcales bacterium]|nr:fasciclin domain-containing protein [Myxococcales bacterium]